MTIRGGRGPRDDMAAPVQRDGGRRPNGYQRTGRYGHGPGDQRKFERYGDRRGGLGGVLGFVVFLVVMAVVVMVALFTVARPIARLAIVPWAEGNPGALRIGFVEDLVREDLGAALTAPASNDTSETVFTVESGDTPATLAPRLAEAGIIASERAFLFEARMDGLGDRLQAGRYALAMNLTPAEVVEGLVDNRIITQTADVTFREGLRLEQITAKLATLTDTDIDPAEFYELATKPTDEILADYPWLLDEKVRPKGASLEGFLYPATYSVRTDGTDPTDAEDLLRMMLNAFHDNVGEDRLAVPAKRGLSFYEVLTLASIVEREAVLDDERPLIAGVYQNRIDRDPERQARPAPGRPDGHLRGRHRQPGQVRPGLGEVRVLDRARRTARSRTRRSRSGSPASTRTSSAACPRPRSRRPASPRSTRPSPRTRRPSTRTSSPSPRAAAPTTSPSPWRSTSGSSRSTATRW